MSKIVLTERQFNILEASVKKDERIKLYQDEHILVVVPLSFQASCKYGANTTWCTATPSSNESYNTYSNNGIFFYFIIKSPYQNAKIKEYKFAYYHSFNKSYDNRTGWYDMDDYFYQENDPRYNGQKVADIKLIEFLIPEFIFEKVSEYIESQNSSFFDKNTNIFQKLFKKIENDSNNNIITKNNEFLIFYRNIDFEPNYGDGIPLYILNNNIGLNVFYCNLINNRIYRQSFSYYYDISNINIRNFDNNEYVKIFKLENNGLYELTTNINILITLMKNISTIKPHYYQQRKLNYTGDTVMIDNNEIPYDKEKHNQ